MIKKSDFIISITDYKKALTDHESYLLLGRSNVGKSSFINSLTGRKSLARVSANPGKTITLNYYLINESFYLVDAPGYGYARRSKKEKDDFIIMIDSFVRKISFKNIFQLIDFKVGPTSDDLDMYEYLISNNHDVIIVVTKTDKVKRSDVVKRKKEILAKLNNPESIFYTSSETKEGINEIVDLLVENN